jgi:hypothetical protein
MPGIPYQNIVVTRNGAAIGSYQAKVATKTGRTHDHISSALEHGQVPRFLIFENVDAPIRIGDLVSAETQVFAGSSIAIVFGVRQYARSLQVDLQLLMAQTYKVWMLGLMSESLNESTGNIKDANYSLSPTTISAYLEPMSAPETLMTIGTADERAAYAFSTMQIVANTVLTLAPDIWLAHHTSDYWPLIGMYRTPMRRLVTPPDGVML